MNKKQQTEKSKRELLFMLPIDKSMSVDEVYLKLIELMKEKGIKIYPDEKEVNWNFKRCYFKQNLITFSYN